MKSTTLPLYCLFLSFIMAAMLSIVRDDNILYYLSSFFGVSSVLFIITLNIPKKSFRFNSIDAIFVSCIFLLVTFSMLIYSEPMGFVLFLVYFSIIAYFKIINLSILRLLKVINITYICYLLLSIISYSGLFFSNDVASLNSFTVDYGFILFETLYGLEGSTASIDSYSTLVLLLNIFFNKELSKYLIIISAFFALLWTTRFTPIIMFFFSMISYVIIRNRFSAVLAICSIFVAFFSFSFLEMFYADESFFIKDVPNGLLLNIATHGRTFIWSEQFQSILNNFNWLDFLIGNYQYAEIFIPWGEGVTSNSHNSFFSLYFRNGIVAVIMIIFFIRKIFYSFDRRTFPIIFGIFLSATTNGTVFYVGNPVFLLVLIYLTYFYKKYNIVR